MKYKKCSCCGKEKIYNLEFFMPDKRTKSGMAGRCRKCHRKISKLYSRKYRQEHPEWKKESNKKCKNIINKCVRRWIIKHPKKLKAKILAGKALKNGKLQKQKCKICKKIKTEMHHPNYNKPLKIIWLCKLHHKQLHAGILKLCTHTKK